MSENRDLIWARRYLAQSLQEWGTENANRNLYNATEALCRFLESLQSPQMPSETTQSGLTSPESGGASPETSTTSTPETATTAPTSSRSEPGQQWEGQVYHPLLYQPSRTTAPTSSTPSTDRSTGPCAHSVNGKHVWRLQQTAKWNETAQNYETWGYCMNTAFSRDGGSVDDKCLASTWFDLQSVSPALSPARR